MLCPCGSNKAYVDCCEIYISGKQLAPTPEALMRSRYTAYTQANMDYIQASMKGVAAEDFNSEVSKQWAQHVKWLNLEVLNASAITAKDTVGFVEFIAHYIFNHKKENIHEMSEFHRENNHWYYVGGKASDTETISAHTNKIGRNDPCPCGSGKKYKKCCNP